MNRQELYDVINSDKNSAEFVYQLCGKYPDVYEKDATFQKLADLGYTIESVEGYGGEGCGDQYWGVFSLEKDGVKTYWRLSGYYASYNGAEVDLSSLEEVKKKEVTTFKWVKK